MIKNIAFLFFLLFVSQIALANKVEDLKTDSDVVKFITSLDKMFTQKYSARFILKSPDEILNEAECGDVKSWKVKNWEKVDFNNYGKTDILVNTTEYDQFFTFKSPLNHFNNVHWNAYIKFEDLEI